MKGKTLLMLLGLGLVTYGGYAIMTKAEPEVKGGGLSVRLGRFASDIVNWAKSLQEYRGLGSQAIGRAKETISTIVETREALEPTAIVPRAVETVTRHTRPFWSSTPVSQAKATVKTSTQRAIESARAWYSGEYATPIEWARDYYLGRWG